MSKPKSEPLYAVIIPHKDDTVRLEKCLHSLVVKTCSPDKLAATEVLVVDNGSDADLSPLMDQFPMVRFTSETRPGAAMARNRGVRETTADRIFFLDCDCVPRPDWLETAAQHIEGEEIVGGRIETFDETSGPRTGAQAFEAVFAFHQKTYIEQKKFSVTANLLTWRPVFEKVGDFRPGVSEDLDWCVRAGEKGFRLVYCDALTVAHPTRSDWAALCRKWRRLVDESFALHRARNGTTISWFLRAGAVLASPVIDLVRVWKSPKLNSARDRLLAAATLFRLRALRAWWMLKQSARQGANGR